MLSTRLFVVLAFASGCSSDDGAQGRVDAVPDRDALDAQADVTTTTDLGEETVAPDTGAPDVPDTTPEDTGADTASDTASDSAIGDTLAPDTTPEDVALDTGAPDTTPDTTPDDVALDTAAPDTTPDDVALDTASEDSAAPDTSPEDVALDTGAPDTTTDTGGEVVVASCGDGLVEGQEACDDGDDCDRDGCSACTFDPALALVELELDPDVGWDLDDADGDGDPTTGIDNRLAASAAVRVALSSYVGERVAAGEILLLAILGDVDALGGDADARLTLAAGDDACPPSDPPAWLTRDATPAPVRRDPDAFSGCEGVTAIDDDDDPGNGILAAPPRLRYWADRIPLALGALGELTLVRARIEGALALEAGALRGLDGGRIGGVVPAASLYMIDTSGLTPLCPTALHAVLGLAGHIDQDAEGDGGKDFILWTTTPGIPCLTAPVNISACCDDGDCTGGRIEGPGCVLDARIGDGFSAAFRVSANAVQVVGPADAVCAP